MTDLWLSLRYCLRVLGKSPGFAAVSVVSLALGIGANTAIFTLIDALLLQNPPVRQPEGLVELSVLRRGDKIQLSFPMFREVEHAQRVFSDLSGWSLGEPEDVEWNGVLARGTVRSVTGNYFSELGTTPLLGRLLTPEDVKLSAGGGEPLAVLSYPFWQHRLGGSSEILGKQINIEGKPFTIIGVTRKWFAGTTPGEPPDVTVPMKTSEDRSMLWVFATGRLKGGVTVAQAQAQLQSFWPAVLIATASTETPGLRRQLFLSMRLDVSPLATGLARELRSRYTRPLFVLMGIVGLMLLIACVNLASLMLARGAARSHEMSLRVALGASSWTIVRQVLIESLTLSVSGAVLGLALAYAGSRLLVALLTEGYLTPVMIDLRPDWRVLLLTGSVAIATGIVAGLLPAWRSSRADPVSSLQQKAQTLATATGKLGRRLMTGQVALSLVLLLGAGLLVRSFQTLGEVEPGLRDNLLQIGLSPRPGGYDKLDVHTYHRQLIERIASIPGANSVTFSHVPIAGGADWRDTVSTMRGAKDTNAGVMANASMVSPGFFSTLGISLVGGRSFEDTDDTHHPNVAIISRSLAEQLFPAGNALGQRIRFSFMPEFQGIEVVGITNNARLFDLHNAAAPAIYFPYQQHTGWSWRGYLFVRINGDQAALERNVGRVIESMGHEYPVSTRTVREEVGQALVEERVTAALASLFAALALVLTAIGLYGLISYSVSCRTREIGLRTALGAQRERVLWLVLREALTIVLIGIAIGIPSAIALSHLIASMIFGVSPSDWPTLGSVSSLLLLVALIAGYIPARRASRLDPVVALRME